MWLGIRILTYHKLIKENYILLIYKITCYFLYIAHNNQKFYTVSIMGFIITSSYTVPKINVTVSNLYVTVLGAYTIRKNNSGTLPVIGMNGRQLSISAPCVYVISCTYYLSTSKGAAPLYTAQQTLQVSDIPVDIYADLYAAIKNNFPNSTFVNN